MKTPKGVSPRVVRDQARMIELEAGIREYTAAKQVIPKEWIIELAELVAKSPLRIVQFQFFEDA